MSVINLKTLIRSMDWQRETLPGSSDSELLAAFCDHRCSKAFANIVDRYGTLVLRVCMRVLGDLHDAEDAFQATFLILARKASTIRNRSSLGSFLHGVAHRTARNLLRTRRRHKKHESWTDSEDRSRLDQEIGWSEVQAALDEEIQRLPTIYRQVFIHCCLEGQSRADTARELGVKEGTLSSRLTQSKKILQVRLNRRGISLSSLLGVLSLTMVAASQELRTQTTARVMEALAGAGNLGWSASIVTFAHRVHVTPFLYQSLSVLAFLAVLAVGTAMSMNSAPSILDHEPRKELVPDPASPKLAATRLSASGTVVNPEGKPVAGATVYLREWSFLRRNYDRYPFTHQAGKDVLAKMTTDETGRFTFKDVIAPEIDYPYMRGRAPYEILVMASGYAPAWQHLTPLLQKQPLYMQLGKSAQVSGTVLDEAGKPSGGTTVRLLDIGPLRRMFGHEWPDDDYLYLKDSAIRIEAKTDALGRFTFSDLPAGSCVQLEATHGGNSEPPVFVAVTDQPQHDLALINYSGGVQSVQFRPVQISPATIRLQPMSQVTGTVLSEDTGKPLAGIDVYIFCQNDKRVKVTTDANGSFTATTANGSGFRIACDGGKRHPEYLEQYIDQAKQQTEPVIIKLPRGHLVSGKVIDAETGQAVPRATVSRGMPPKNGSGQWVWWPTKETNDQGEFQYYVPSGQLKLRATTPEMTHSSVESNVYEVSPGKPLTNLKLAMAKNKHPGLSGRVLDPNGHPVEGAYITFGPTLQRGQHHQEAISGLNGRFSLPVPPEALREGEASELVVIHEQLHLGAIYGFQDEGQQNPWEHPPEIKLKPLAKMTGRVLDPQGKPLRNSRVTLTAQIESKRLVDGIVRTEIGGAEFSSIETLTDQDGRYQLDHILPGAGIQYRVLVSAPGMAGLYGRQVTVEPGQTVDTGDIKLVAANETISGIVVDSAGKPASHIWVQAYPASKPGDTAMQGNPGILVTKEDGKFTLRHLPKGKLELRYEDVKPGKAPATHRMEPQMVVDSGRQDIRVVIEKDK